MIRSYLKIGLNIFRVLNIFWYLLLTPLFIIYLLLHAGGMKDYLLCSYQYIIDSISMFISLKMKELAVSDSSAIKNKHGLDRVAGAGNFPLTVCLGLFYTPFYICTMFFWSTHDFFKWNIPLMLIFSIVCCEDTHYDSHFWLTKRQQSVWYRRLIGGRFKQYSQMIWYPLTQHIPHLHIHHKFNMKNEKDVDYVGCYQRDGLKGFIAFLTIYEWNYTWVALKYFYSLPSRSLLQLFVRDLLLHYSLLIFAAYCGWQKLLFQYTCHCLCHFLIAWVTFFLEHPFHHTIDNSYEHHWNILTIVDSNSGLCAESHTAHHIWPAQTTEENAAWANDPIKFSLSQLNSKHLAMACDGWLEELLYIPYLMMTSQYARLSQMLHFKDPDQLILAGMQADLIEAYRDFIKGCDADEIRCRLQAR